MQHTQLEAAGVIGSVLQGNNLTQVLAERLRKNSTLTQQQRGALQDLCYGSLRQYRRLEFILTQLMKSPPREALMQNLMLIALYQLEFTRVGHHVIVDQAVSAAKKINPRSGGLVNAVLRNFQRNREVLLQKADQNEESKYSYPQWWIDILKQQFGEKVAEILEAGNQHPPMTLRVNVKQTSVAAYQKILEDQGIGAQVKEPEALLLEQPTNVERLPNFKEGWVSVQDAGAQYAAHFIDVANGMRVLDACSAPGGKAAHLLERVNIELVALDKDEERLKRVRDNLQRLNLNAQVVCGDAAKPADWWDGKQFDRILADVPCSASGVVRRHPDIKWLRRATDINAFAEQQNQILEALWPLLKADGKLLYATCSIFAKENQQVINGFLKRHREATQQEIVQFPSGQLLPNSQNDGFFYALLQKNT